MIVIRFPVAVTAVWLAINPATAETPARVRGTITAVDASSITVKQKDDRDYKLQTNPATVYSNVVPSSLDTIRVYDYIGTAIKGLPEQAIAVEIVLVPEDMRAGRRGFYDWDPLPDTSGVDTSGTTATSMTNGTVVAVDAASAKKLTLTVALVSDQTAHIAVSPSAPITRFVRADRSVVSVGSATVVWSTPDGMATLVAVGKGVVPPM